MKKAAMLTVAVYLAMVSSLFASGYGDWPIRQQDSVVKKLALSGGTMRVDVDNVNGYVHVIADGGSEVEMRAHKTIRAETDADLAQAQKEVSLDMQEQNGTVSILYDAPWRCREHASNCGDHHRRFYEVIYDIDLRVPRGSRLAVSTVNNGDVQVKNSSGSFEVRNVNGAISMEGISGSGEVKTVNGPISIRFVKEPSEACIMKTVNGSVDAYFPRHLSADLLFKTFNGQVYTDFDVTPRSSAEQQPARDGGKFVYRSNRFIAGRVGQGGREYSFETLNGDIRLHEQN
jgi:hypothetical protein